jgi:integrase
MPRTTKRLTVTEVDNAKPKDKEYTLAHGNGLYLRIKPNGSKNWLFNYINPNTRKRTNISIGNYPDLSLSNASKKRTEFRELLADGIDPKQHRIDQERTRKEANTNTLKHVASDWLDTKKLKITAEYALDIERALERHVFHRLGNKPIGDIRVSEFRETLKPLESVGKLETIKRLLQNLNQIMEHAVLLEIIENNKIRSLQSLFQSPIRKHQPSIHPDELPDLMKSIKAANIKITTRCLIEWQLHTMTRPAEAAHTRWDEIDFPCKTWTIPIDRMKKRREHVVPLTPEALDILGTMKPLSGNREHVFPADRNPRKPMNSQSANMALKRMGYKGKLVAHGIRSIASTALNEARFDSELIEVALSHVDKNQTRAAYQRSDYLEQRREIMEWWSRFLVEASPP